MNIVLTSGVALGAHVPGMLINKAYLARGLSSRVYVLERLLPEDVKQRIRVAKGRYSRDYRLAKAAHALATNNSKLIRDNSARTLFEEWDSCAVGSIIVVSGFWVDIVQAYVGRRPGILVDMCHLDAIASPSYRGADVLPGSTHSWLLNWRTNSINEGIFIGESGVQVPWTSRSIGFLGHGGGWGMGTHAAASLALAEAGESVSLIVTGQQVKPLTKLSVYHQEPSWEPWSNAGFPPLVPGRGASDSPFLFRERWHDAFELTRRSCAVISKPGAGTLIDSLNAATPVLFTEALGNWEVANEGVWCALGFGMRLSEWMVRRDPSTLEAMHERLRVARASVGSYPDRLVSLGFGALAALYRPRRRAWSCRATGRSRPVRAPAR